VVKSHAEGRQSSFPLASKTAGKSAQLSKQAAALLSNFSILLPQDV
jgi:hypothetical protein